MAVSDGSDGPLLTRPNNLVARGTLPLGKGVPGETPDGSVQHAGTSAAEGPEISPWRVDGARGRTRTLRLDAVLDAARGPHLGPVDAKVLLFIAGHVAALTVAFTCDTDLAATLQEATSPAPSPAAHAKLALLALCLLGNALLYGSLYRSDPGWVTAGGHAAAIGPPDVVGPCVWCTLPGHLRRRHDHNTGQCVVRFDHYCPLLATAIGSRNAPRFFWFCASQTFLLVWGILLAVTALGSCLFFWDLPLAGQCWGARPIKAGVLFIALGCFLLLLNAFGGLLVLHGYLAATNQTTYELLRGSSVPYLTPHFEGYKGPSAVMLPRGTACLIRRHIQGVPPPAPFSRGVLENLNAFFYEGNPPGMQSSANAAEGPQVV